MQAKISSLVTVSKLKEILKVQSSFTKSYRLLEASMGEDAKPSFEG